MAKDFAFDDLVWAKMKGFPPWPARISQPPDGSSAKSKKPQHFVYFFGTHDVAWILDELIVPHSEEMLTNASNYKKKASNYKTAIEEIKEESLKATPKPKNLIKEKGKKEITRSKSPELDSIPSTSKTSKKSLSKNRIEKKKPKKQPALNVDQGSNSSKAEDYSQLLGNVLPNYAMANIAVIPPYEGQVALASLTEPFSLASASGESAPMQTLLPTHKKLGFIGLGVMGGQMVRNLLQCGNNVTVWNRTIEKCDEFVIKGAQKAETPADLVRACDIIFCCVSDSEAVKSFFSSEGGVMEGFSGGGSRAIGNKGYVELTSIDPTTSQELSEAICGAGGRYLEAPMIGSRQQLNDGTMVIIAAGDRHLFKDCCECFNVWARHAFFQGSEVGSGLKLKLLINMVLGGTYAAIAEGLALVEKCGIPPQQFMDALGDGPLNCPMVMNKGNAMLQNNAVVEQPVKHLQKDLDMAIALSNKCDQPLQVTVSVNETFKRAKREFAEEDVSAIHKCYKFA